MKNAFLLSLFTLLLLWGCEKVEIQPGAPKMITSASYIRSLILPDTRPPYRGSYYIQVKAVHPNSSSNKEILFSEVEHDMSVWHAPTDGGLGMSIQGVHFRDKQTTESLEITFYFNSKTDSTFNICYADYYFSNPWDKKAGANVHYFTPVKDTPENYQFYQYLGTNSPEAFFQITYLGNNRINGRFKTKWKECCGGPSTYEVEGDFSIPDIRYFLN